MFQNAHDNQSLLIYPADINKVWYKIQSLKYVVTIYGINVKLKDKLFS